MFCNTIKGKAVVTLASNAEVVPQPSEWLVDCKGKQTIRARGIESVLRSILVNLSAGAVDKSAKGHPAR